MLLAIEVQRDTRKGGEHVACYEFETEEARSMWLASSAPFAIRQRIEATHKAARGARLCIGGSSTSRPLLVLQPSY